MDSHPLAGFPDIAELFTPAPERLPVRPMLEEYNRPHKIDHGLKDGFQIPAACLSFSFHGVHHGDDGWSGAYFRLDDGPDEIATALEMLAAKIRAREWGAVGEEVRLGNELNIDAVKDLLDTKAERDARPV